MFQATHADVIDIFLDKINDFNQAFFWLSNACFQLIESKESPLSDDEGKAILPEGNTWSFSYAQQNFFMKPK